MATISNDSKTEAQMNADYLQMLSALRSEDFPAWMEQVGNTFMTAEEASAVLGNENQLSRKGDDDYRDQRWENLVSIAKRVLGVNN